MTILHLTKDERKQFESLSGELREGWNVEEERGEAQESAEELRMRYEMASFSNPHCKELCEKAKKVKTAAEMEKIAASFDLSSLNFPEIGELFFVLGTTWISHMIGYLLQNVKTDEDIEGLMTLSQIRHMLLEVSATPV